MRDLATPLLGLLHSFWWPGWFQWLCETGDSTPRHPLHLSSTSSSTINLIHIKSFSLKKKKKVNGDGDDYSFENALIPASNKVPWWIPGLTFTIWVRENTSATVFLGNRRLLLHPISIYSAQETYERERERALYIKRKQIRSVTTIIPEDDGIQRRKEWIKTWD